MVRISLDAGVNTIDTANVYANGESELLVGQALKDLEVRRESVVIATKVLGGMGPGPNDAGLGRKHILSQVKASLERLQLDYIDLYQIHGRDPTTPIEETMGAMNDLVRSGLVRYIGCSNLSAWEVMKANWVSDLHDWPRFESVQSYYTIAGRDIEREIMPMLIDQGMGLLVWSPLAGGFLTGKYRKGEEVPEGGEAFRLQFPSGGPRSGISHPGCHERDRHRPRGFRSPGGPVMVAQPRFRDQRDCGGEDRGPAA